MSTLTAGPVTATSDEDVNGTAHAIREVHERAGLTWEQIARLFGVSRRSVHLWASGGRMSAANEESLLKVVDLLDSLQSLSKLDVRRAILSSFEDARRARSAKDDDINRPALVWSGEAGASGPI